MGADLAYMLIILKSINSKQYSEINAAPSNMGNVSKDVSSDNMKNIGLYKYVYDFSVDYDSIDVNDILDIHKYLMKKHDIT